MNAAALSNNFVTEKATPDRIIIANRRAHCPVHLEGQTHPLLSWTAVTVITLVRRRQERRHGIGVGIVQFDTVKARLLRPCRGLRKQWWQGLRQRRNTR